MAERQWPLPPAANAKDIYVWAQELTRLLTQRLNPLLAAAALSSSVSVRAATTANVALASELENGDTLDGVTLSTGDIVLVKDQSSGEENGIYKVPASGAAQRGGGFVTFNSHVGAIVTVQEGTTNGGTTWRGTSAKGGTLGTTAITFEQIGTVTNADIADMVEASATLTDHAIIMGDGSGRGVEDENPDSFTGDLDNLLGATLSQKLSWRRIATGASGQPAGAGVQGSHVLQFAWDSNACWQLFLEHNTRNFYVRSANFGVFGAWERLALQSDLPTWTYTSEVSVNSGSSAIVVSGVPSGITELEVLIKDVEAVSSSSRLALRLGDSGGIETSGYDSSAMRASNNTHSTDALNLTDTDSFNSGHAYSGIAKLALYDESNNDWVMSAQGGHGSAGGGRVSSSAGHKALSAALTQIQILFPDGESFQGSGVVKVRYR